MFTTAVFSGVPDTDSAGDEDEELPGEEAGGSGDTR